MKKVVILAVTALALAVASLAYAQAQQNRYNVTGGTSPTSAGTSKKPVPVSVSFNYTVGEIQNRRPSVIRKYNIRFAGLNVNTAPFPKCSQSVIDQQGASGCPAGSIVGTGFIENQTGATNNPSDKSIECNAGLQVINLGNNRASIFVQGDPQQSDPRRRCAITLAAGIPARFIRQSGGRGTSLEFTVPESLRHPGAPTISNAVVRVQSTIKRLTRRVNGRTVGFFESIGGCVRNKRNITVTFTPEQGSAARAQHLANCRR
jgi:hypothetical protein